MRHDRISNRIMLNSVSTLSFLSSVYVRTSIICFYITFGANGRGKTDELRGKASSRSEELMRTHNGVMAERTGGCVSCVMAALDGLGVSVRMCACV